MTTFHDQTFWKFFDSDSSAVFEDIVFNNCVFDNCALSSTKSPALRTTVKKVQLVNCVSRNCDVGPAIVDEATIDGLETNALLLMWGPLFKHVTIRGKIGKIKINLASHFLDRTPEIQGPFNIARSAFYETVDWALDISQAQFKVFEMRGVPARLVRRDPDTQVVVTREKALRSEWRLGLSPSNTHWPFVIDMFLADGEPDIVLVAPKRARKQHFANLVEGLNELRTLGVAEPD
jgi:hypothetical protein